MSDSAYCISVCLRVLQRENLALGNVKLSVTLWEEEGDEVSRAIIVSGFDSETIPDEMIKLLFENEKKSKGGEIEMLDFIENGVAQITFKDMKGLCIFFLQYIILHVHVVEGMINAFRDKNYTP